MTLAVMGQLQLPVTVIILNINITAMGFYHYGRPANN